MCIICQQWELQKLTSKEAFRAIGEVLSSTKDKEKVKHLTELSEKIISKEVPESEKDEQLEHDWQSKYEDGDQ